MLNLLVFFFCNVCILLACVPGFKYIPGGVGNTEKQESCIDCTMAEGFKQFRFFTEHPCCNQISTKVDPARLKNATQCGRKGGEASKLRVMDDKVVGGNDALENELPWQVAILRMDGGWAGCGALLLSCDPVIVVTAAHCVVISELTQITWPAQFLKVAFGAHIVELMSSDKMGEHEVRMDVEEIIVHPSFARYTMHAGIKLRSNLNVTLYENDIAVVKVKNATDLQCNRKWIWPACLPNKNTEYSGWNRTILSGWGRVAGDENVDFSKPRILKKTSVPIVSDSECSSNWNSTIFEKQICAGNLEEGRGSCSGDSGGPLVTEDANQSGWTAVGIVSWGSTRCLRNLLGVYTEVGQYLDWISSQFGLLPPT